MNLCLSMMAHAFNVSTCKGKQISEIQGQSGLDSMFRSVIVKSLSQTNRRKIDILRNKNNSYKSIVKSKYPSLKTGQKS